MNARLLGLSALIASSVFSTFSCSCASVRPAPALGESPVDNQLLSANPNLQHLAVAIDGNDRTLTELFQQGDKVVFKQAPDPTELLVRQNTIDDARAETGTPLKVLTYNLALLDVKIFGFIGYARSPLLDERVDELPDLVFSDDADVIFLQELWRPEDVTLFRNAAAQKGYSFFIGPRESYNDGVATLIRDSVKDPAGAVAVDAFPYEAQVSSEYFPGPSIMRGALLVTFVHKDLGPIVAANSHMQAFPENWGKRSSQARQLGMELTKAVATLPAGSLAIVGGDFNSGPYYFDDKWALPKDGKVQTQWWNNAMSYAMLLAYGDLVDLAVMGRPAADAASDVVLGNTVLNDPSKALTVPNVDPNWCRDTPRTTFTATDCNSLYFQQYAGTEYPARLDHLMAHDPQGRVKVVSSSIVHTDAQSFNTPSGSAASTVTTEPSDHFGVSVVLNVQPLP